MPPYECGVILAGGKSTRMGQDKALLPFGGAPTMTHYLHRTLRPYFRHLYVSAKTDKFHGAFSLLYDRYDIASPLGAIVTALSLLPYKRIFVVSVDMPLMHPDVIARLYRRSTDDAEIVAAFSDKAQPLCAVYTQHALATLHHRLKAHNHALTPALFACRTRFVCFDATHRHAFLNLNTPPHYRNALLHAQ